MIFPMIDIVFKTPLFILGYSRRWTDNGITPTNLFWYYYEIMKCEIFLTFNFRRNKVISDFRNSDINTKLFGDFTICTLNFHILAYNY